MQQVPRSQLHSCYHATEDQALTLLKEVGGIGNDPRGQVECEAHGRIWETSNRDNGQIRSTLLKSDMVGDLKNREPAQLITDLSFASLLVDRNRQNRQQVLLARSLGL